MMSVLTTCTIVARCAEEPLLTPLSPARPRFLPIQFIRSSGILCTKYSRCSLGIVHIGRFFCVISSSRFLRSCSRLGNQIRSHEQINGLSMWICGAQTVNICVGFQPKKYPFNKHISHKFTNNADEPIYCSSDIVNRALNIKQFKCAEPIIYIKYFMSAFTWSFSTTLYNSH